MVAKDDRAVSFAYRIHQAYFDALGNREPYFANFFKRSEIMVPVQPDQLPFLGVYLRQDRQAPDGDANQGMIRFKHTVRIAVSVIVACNDSGLAAQELDIALDKIMTRLWCDPKITNRMRANAQGNVVVESLEGGVADRQFGNQQLNNQTPLAELQYEISASFRDYWYPTITDDFLRMDVYGRLKEGSLPVKSRYLFEPSPPE